MAKKTVPQPTPIQILERLIIEFRAKVTILPDCRKAAIEELQKYIEFGFDDIEELRGRWNILEDDEELAEKRMVYDLNSNKAKAHLERCKARLAANVAYGKELKKIPTQTEGGQTKKD
jgi:predicted nuclease with TOPRIM domain